jgi:hypothetical protein
MSPTEGSSNLHPLSNARAREGVPLQPLSDATAEDRDRARPLPHGATDQDLVPEPTDEAEKGAARGEGDQRTSATGEGRAGPAEAGEACQDGSPFASPVHDGRSG